MIVSNAAVAALSGLYVATQSVAVVVIAACLIVLLAVVLGRRR
ncbi:hypothetical protein [Amycolatopsis sp. CA-128772]|nr:hypothetical protein [Amycolatopsis sp. CA-128772]